MKIQGSMLVPALPAWAYSRGLTSENVFSIQRCSLAAGFLAACALAVRWQHGHLCLVAWYSASAARAYEVGLRSLFRGPRALLAAKALGWPRAR